MTILSDERGTLAKAEVMQSSASGSSVTMREFAREGERRMTLAQLLLLLNPDRTTKGAI
jgi:hypothetical protein